MNKVSLKNKIFYGFGSIGISVMDAFLGSYLILYVTDVLKLDALLFASLLIAPKVVDIIIDIFIMYFVGKTKTKFGMYRPWLLNAIPLSIAFVLMFTTPYFNISTGWTLAIMVITYFFSSAIFDSLYYIPYTAISGVLSEDEGELVKISASKTLFENLSFAVVSIVTMPILLAFGSYKNPDGWLVTAGIFGSLGLIFSLMCFFGVQTNPVLESKFTREYSVKDTAKDYKNIFTNKKFLFACILLFITYFTCYVISNVSYYFYIYNLGMESQITYLAIEGAILTIVSSFLATYLYKKVKFKYSFIISAICLIIYAIMSMFTYSQVMMYFTNIFRIVGSSMLITLVFSLWPKIANGLDKEKVKAPLNNTMGLSNVIGNLSALLGSTVGAAIITISKYDSSVTTQSDFTLSIIRFVAPIITIALMILFIIVVIIGYRKKKVK